MAKAKPQQKFISFSTDPSDIKKIEQSMNDGWSIVQLVDCADNQYMGIMEKLPSANSSDPEEQTIYLPRKKKFAIK